MPEWSSLENDVTFDQFAKVASRTTRFDTEPLAQYRRAFTFEEIKGADMVSYPNTVPMCCPTTDGSAAVSGRVERAPGLARPRPAPAAVKISASSIQSQPCPRPSRSNPISTR